MIRWLLREIISLINKGYVGIIQTNSWAHRLMNALNYIHQTILTVAIDGHQMNYRKGIHTNAANHHLIHW